MSEPTAQGLIEFLRKAFPSPGAAQPDTGLKDIPLLGSSKSDWADYLINLGPVGTLANSLGFSKFEDLPWGMDSWMYERYKRMSEMSSDDFEDDQIAGEWARGEAQRSLIDYWRDKMEDDPNVSFSQMNEYRRLRDEYLKDPSIGTYNAIQAAATRELPNAASPNLLEDSKAKLINNYLTLIESGDISAKRRDELKNKIDSATSFPKLDQVKDELITTIQTRVPGERWSEQITQEITERGGTTTPEDWKPKTTFSQQGLDELGGMPAFSGEYSQIGQQGKFNTQNIPDPVAEAIARLTGPDGWPVRLENGNVLLYRGSLPDGSPMLLGEFDWNEETEEMFKVGSGSAADPTAITTSLFEAADGSQRLINSVTGELIKDLGQGFAAMDSNRNFDQRADQFSASERRLGSQFGQTFGEDVRQFNQSLGENQRQFNMGYGLDRDRFGEDVRQFNTGFGETQRQFDTTEGRMERTLAANNYFQGLEELGRNYRTLVQTSPDLANAATNQGELIRNILTNGGDVLARTYFTRGGISPLPEITQADLINNLNTEVQNIAKFENASIDAENRRRTQADASREREEFAQFRAANAADARAAYGRYTNEMVPTTREDYDAGGFSSAQATYNTQRAAADKRIADLNTFSEFISAPNAVDSSGTAFQDVATQQADIQAQIAAANAGVMGAPNPGAFTSFSTTTPTPMSYEDWVTTSQFGAPQMGFEQWKTNVGPSFAPSQLLNVPEVPMPRATTQAELIANSRATTPPAVQSVLSGQMPTPLQFGGLPLPTFQQLQALTPTEQEMLNSRLMTEFNVPLSDVAFQSQRSFGAPSVDRNKDLARFRGYAV